MNDLRAQRNGEESREEHECGANRHSMIREKNTEERRRVSAVQGEVEKNVSRTL
jgi:hypothetical protein